MYALPSKLRDVDHWLEAVFVKKAPEVFKQHGLNMSNVLIEPTGDVSFSVNGAKFTGYIDDDPGLVLIVVGSGKLDYVEAGGLSISVLAEDIVEQIEEKDLNRGMFISAKEKKQLEQIYKRITKDYLALRKKRVGGDSNIRSKLNQFEHLRYQIAALVANRVYNRSKQSSRPLKDTTDALKAWNQAIVQLERMGYV